MSGILGGLAGMVLGVLWVLWRKYDIHGMYGIKKMTDEQYNREAAKFRKRNTLGL